MGAKKNNKVDGKPEVGYLHPETLKQLSYAHQAGALKYGEFNYLKGHSERQLIEATIRHLYAYLWEGELDKDTTDRLGKDVTHLGCCLANINMLITQDVMDKLTKDAPHRKVKDNG